MKLCWIFLLIALSVCNIYGALNEAQVKAGAKLIRNNCMKKTMATLEQIDNMHKGIWDEDRNAKCYANCCLKMMKLSKKNGAFDLEGGLKQLSQLPEARLGPVTNAMKKCEDAGADLDDKCDRSYDVMKCLYNADPENYIYP